MTNKLCCRYCDKEFKYESEKKRHEISHSPRFQCDICKKKFSFISALKRHEKQHERTGKVQCKQCSRSFRDESLLKRHVEYAHKGKYMCKKCDTEFHSELALGKHEKIHNAKAERKYHCRYNGCEKTFNFPHHLKHHELTHTNSKQHFCQICKKGFIQFHHLKAHIKIHEPEKWLQCTEINCKKTFSTEYSRKRHLLRTHNIKINDILSAEFDQDGNDFEDSIKSNTFQNIVLAESEEILLDKEQLSKCSAISNEHPKDFSGSKHVDQENVSKYSETCNGYIENVSESKHVGVNKEISDNTDLNITPDINDCKSVLGSCIMNAESLENCLCAQIKTTADNCYDDIFIEDENINSTNMISNLQSFEPYKATNEDDCKNCECSVNLQSNNCFGTANGINSNKIKENDIPKRICSSQNIVNSTVPEIEYKADGSIKLKDTFDSDIKVLTIVNIDINMNKKNELYDSNFVPFNSCKAVLGKCIVSGNGTISEGCLCAKMVIDDHEINAEEIDEITPHPANSGLSSCVM